MADGPGIFRPADLQRALSIDALRRRLSEGGLGLRHVGAGYLADAKPVAGCLQLSAQHQLIVAGDLHQRLVAHGIEISLGHGLKHRGLDPEGLGPGRLNRVDGLTRLRLGAATAIERLRHPKVERSGGKAGKSRRGTRCRHPSPGKAGLAGEGDRRPPVRQRLWHLLVRRAKKGALREQLGVGVVGVGKGLSQRLRRSRRGSK